MEQEPPNTCYQNYLLKKSWACGFDSKTKKTGEQNAINTNNLFNRATMNETDKTRMVIIALDDLLQILTQSVHEAFIEIQKQQNNSKTYSINQASKKLGRSHKTVSKLIANGLLIATADNKITESALNEYLKKYSQP